MLFIMQTAEKTIRNIAVILKDKEQVSTSSASVNYDGTWIKKELNGITGFQKKMMNKAITFSLRSLKTFFIIIRLR